VAIAAHPRIAELTRELGLTPHPEGGSYREVWRSPSQVRPSDGRGPRSAMTTIWFLLAAGEWSRWHRVLSDEAWQLVEGQPLEILVVAPDVSSADRVVLEAGPSGRHVVPAGWWQAARALDTYSLATCTVAPGFDFADLTLMGDDPESRRLLHERFATLAWLL